MVVTKTSKAIQLFKQNDLKGSLRLFSRFRIGLSLNEKETLRTAYEILSGHEKFYISLGINTGEIVHEAKEIMDQYVKKYDNKKNNS